MEFSAENQLDLNGQQETSIALMDMALGALGMLTAFVLGVLIAVGLVRPRYREHTAKCHKRIAALEHQLAEARTRIDQLQAMIMHSNTVAVQSQARVILGRQLREARRRFAEMTTMRFGCSGKSALEVEEWFRQRADDALAALTDLAPVVPAPDQGGEELPEA